MGSSAFFPGIHMKLDSFFKAGFLALLFTSNPSLARDQKPINPADMSKMVIEQPVKTLLRERTMEVVPGKVSAGLVKWHADMKLATEAANRSGKPVMVFHLMGNLDDRFC